VVTKVLSDQTLPGYPVKRPSVSESPGFELFCGRKMPHRPKFDEPWMDELDGHDCVQKSVTLGVKAAMVGKYCVLDVLYCVHRRLYKNPSILVLL